jgi:hypothetical protein
MLSWREGNPSDSAEERERRMNGKGYEVKEYKV